MPEHRKTPVEHRLALIVPDLNHYIFCLVEGDAALEGFDAGKIAIAVEKAFRDAVLEQDADLLAPQHN